MTQPATGLPHGAWVLVTDSEKALFLVNIGDAKAMHLDVLRKEEQENPKAQDWAANRRGRFNDGPSVHRSAVDDTDWHELEKVRFAKDLADKLYAHAHRGDFDTLVIVSSRVVLGTLRKELHQEVTDKLMLDVPKVLTNHPIEEIEAAVSAELEAA